MDEAEPKFCDCTITLLPVEERRQQRAHHLRREVGGARYAGGLDLTCPDEPCGFLGREIERLIQENHVADRHDKNDGDEQHRRDQGEFDRRRPAAFPRESS